MRIYTFISSIFSLNPDYKTRVFGLDLMRAVAIIFVVMGHGNWMMNYVSKDFPWIRLFDGVELFFVLSGFLIGGILIRTLMKSETFDHKTILNFWVRRWFRTLPNYYLILLLNVVIVYFGFIREDISQFNWKFLFFLQNFSLPFYDFFWESWSLCIEEWFYLLFPIVLFAVIFFGKRAGFTKRTLFLISILIFLLTSFLLRFFHASEFQVDDFWLGVRINKVVIYRLDGIALGLLAAYIKFWHPDFWFKSRNISFILGILLCYNNLYISWLPNDFSTKVFKILIQSIGCFLLLPKFESIRTAPLFLKKIFTHISLISYSMYLINLALVSEVIRDNFPPHGPKSGLAMYIIYWLVVIMVSTIMYKFYEKPIMDLREKYKK